MGEDGVRQWRHGDNNTPKPIDNPANHVVTVRKLIPCVQGCGVYDLRSVWCSFFPLDAVALFSHCVMVTVRNGSPHIHVVQDNVDDATDIVMIQGAFALRIAPCRVEQRECVCFVCALSLGATTLATNSATAFGREQAKRGNFICYTKNTKTTPSIPPPRLRCLQC